jgi:hypothetical protein
MCTNDHYTASRRALEQLCGEHDQAQRALEALQAENARLRWQMSQMRLYLETSARFSETSEEQYREGGDALLATLHRSCGSSARAALAYLGELEAQPFTLEELRAMPADELLKGVHGE